MTPDELSSELLAALGIDPNLVTAAALRIRPGHWPSLTIERTIANGESVRNVERVVKRFELSPRQEF